MSDLVVALQRLANQLGLQTCLEFDPQVLVPEERIRAFCLENKCGNSGTHYMCPPHIGSLEETAAQLRGFRRGILLRYSRPLIVEKDRREAMQAKIDFHHKILELEGYLKGKGEERVWGIIGGNCELCETCKAITAEPCPYPDKARTSLEALGVDVLALLDKFGLDTQFHPDRITWTGCLLF